MFQHIGVLTLQPDTTREQKAALAAALEALVGVVPGLITASVRLDAGLREGNADLIFRMELADQAAWEGYSVHPAHVAVVNDHIKPVLLAKSFVQLAD
jgi:hypothetical protein